MQTVHKPDYYYMRPEYFQWYSKTIQNFNNDPKMFLSSVHEDEDEKRNQLLKIDGNIARITIDGPLVKKLSFFSQFFGEIAFSDIIESISMSNKNENVHEIHLIMNTPGGEVNGVHAVASAVRNSPKKVVAFADELMASAGIFIGSQASQIVAASPNSLIGSIGVLTVGFVPDKDFFVVLSSTDAPDKFPDLSTIEGKKVVIKELDALHAVFAETVANGRGVSVEKVNNDFGKGGVLIASDALKVGLIDRVLDGNESSSSSSSFSTPAVTKISGQGDDKLYNDDNSVTQDNTGDDMADEIKGEELKEKLEISYKNGQNDEKKRVAELMAWEENNQSTSKIVREAIVSGKSSSEVMPQIMGCISGSVSSPNSDDTPPPVSSTEPTGIDGDTPVSDDSIKQKAKSLASFVIKP